MSSIGEWVDAVILTVLPDVRAALTSALTKNTVVSTSDLAENREDLLDKDHELLNGILDGGPGLVPLAKKKIIRAIETLSSSAAAPGPGGGGGVGVSARKDRVVLDMHVDS